jgi:hypothetical protein
MDIKEKLLDETNKILDDFSKFEVSPKNYEKTKEFSFSSIDKKHIRLY